MKRRSKSLEAIIGRKQMEIDLLNRIIDFGNTEYKTDLKKFIKESLEWFRLFKGINHTYKMKDLYLIGLNLQAILVKVSPEETIHENGERAGH
ncbi:MAG: hypothetical protein U0X76_07385 [Bacteroidia bacterium]